MGFTDEIASILFSAGVGTPLVDIFGSSLKVEPRGDGPFITISETGGTSPDNTQNSTAIPAYRRPAAQIVTRASTKPLAETMAFEAYNALFAIRNENVLTPTSRTWYRKIRPLQEPTDGGLDPQGRIRIIFNVLADKRPSIDTGSELVGYYLIDDLGGDINGFLRPDVADTYPTGSDFDALVPGTSPIVISQLPSGSIVLEASARCEAAGARAKVALFNLDTDTIVAGSELTFTTGEVVGEVKRSTPLILAISTTYGLKMTTNQLLVGAAVWNSRLVHL
jgi:hypothetical protein